MQMPLTTHIHTHVHAHTYTHVQYESRGCEAIKEMLMFRGLILPISQGYQKANSPARIIPSRAGYTIQCAR